MAVRDALLPEFDSEMSNTRKTLERVPDEKLGWKPHPKSGSMGWLAGHLCNIPTWVNYTIEKEFVDLAPVGETPQPPPALPSKREQLLADFDKNVAAARAAIVGASDEHLMLPWSVLRGGKALITMPRGAVLRMWVLNPNIHHRAQLGVYLRLNDIAVPAIYGPSAYEGTF